MLRLEFFTIGTIFTILVFTRPNIIFKALVLFINI